MEYMKRLITFLILCSALLLFSCNQSGMAIFYSVVEEQELAESTLGDELTVSHMLGINGDYYLAASTLFKGVPGASDVTWDTVAGPPAAASGGSGYTICLGIATLAGELYAIFSTIDGTDAAVFRDSGSAWESVYDPVTGEPSHMTVAGGRMFVSVRQGISYSTFETSDGDTFSAVTLDGQSAPFSQSAPVIDAASFQGDLWLVCGSSVYKDTGGSFALLTDSGGPVGSKSGLGGIYASPASSLDTVFVADRDGVVYALPNGGAWDTTDITDDGTDTGSALSLGDFAEVAVGGSTVLLVATAKGYSELIFGAGYSSDVAQVLPGATGSLTSDSNYQNVMLADSSVLALFVDASAVKGPILFAGTGGNGLWRNPIDETASPVVRKWDPE